MAHLEPKPQPYTFDLGLLLCNDTNPLPTYNEDDKEAVLAAVARDNAQALINQLLTACPITKSTDDGGLQINLPAPTTQLPREKPIPKAKEKTKWERFAEKKGIKPKGKDGKLKFDEVSGDWKPKYGYKGKRGDGVQEDWIVEDDGDAADGKKKKQQKRS
ncbi:hypothetical protein MRB53_037268 [Persea americana]|nr:hypothetical protein MRB53_037268 [Persea americana]